MPIICLEGPSAVGKSSTCKELHRRYGAYIVEEVAFLFPKPNLDGTRLIDWVLDCQVERWKIAAAKANDHPLVVLDGDHLKIWYSWVYGFEAEPLEYFNDYFRKLIADRTIGFPDSYAVLTIDEVELRRRKENDYSRTRGNFDKHLRLIEPQLRFFHALEQFQPGLVQFLEATNTEDTLSKLDFQQHNDNKYSLPLFDSMIDWFRTPVERQV